METSCSANRIISSSTIEDRRGGKERQAKIKMGFCVCVSGFLFSFLDGEGAAPGQWGLVRLKGQASGHSIFISLFKSSINSRLFDPPLLNYSAEALLPTRPPPLQVSLGEFTFTGLAASLTHKRVEICLVIFFSHR